MPQPKCKPEGSQTEVRSITAWTDRLQTARFPSSWRLNFIPKYRNVAKFLNNLLYLSLYDFGLHSVGETRNCTPFCCVLYPGQGCTNSGRLVARLTKFCMEAPNIISIIIRISINRINRISQKFFQWQACCCMQTNGQTDRQTDANTHF